MNFGSFAQFLEFYFYLKPYLTERLTTQGHVAEVDWCGPGRATWRAAIHQDRVRLELWLDLFSAMRSRSNRQKHFGAAAWLPAGDGEDGGAAWSLRQRRLLPGCGGGGSGLGVSRGGFSCSRFSLPWPVTTTALPSSKARRWR